MEAESKSIKGILVGLDDILTVCRNFSHFLTFFQNNVFSVFKEQLASVSEVEPSMVVFQTSQIIFRLQKLNIKDENESSTDSKLFLQDLDLVLVCFASSVLREEFLRNYCEGIMQNYPMKVIVFFSVSTKTNEKVPETTVFRDLTGKFKTVKYYHTQTKEVHKVFNRAIKFVLYHSIQQQEREIKMLKQEIVVQEDFRKVQIRKLVELNDKCVKTRKKVESLFDDELEIQNIGRKLTNIQKKVNEHMQEKRFKDITPLLREANRVFQKIKVKEFKKYKILIDFTITDLKEIPQFITIAMEYIQDNYLEEEGIFYRQCSISKLKEVKKMFENKQALHLLKIDIHILTNLIKDWISNLKTPLLENYESFLSAYKENDIEKMKQQLYMIPENKFTLLKMFFNMFTKILNVKDKNNMSEEQIARVFSQIFFFRQDQFKNLVTIKEWNNDNIDPEKVPEVPDESHIIEFINRSLTDSKNILKFLLAKFDFFFSSNYVLERKKIYQEQEEEEKRKELETNLKKLNWEKIVQIIRKRFDYIFNTTQLYEGIEKFRSEMNSDIHNLKKKIDGRSKDSKDYKKLSEIRKSNIEFLAILSRQLEQYLLKFKDKELIEITYIFKLILIEKRKSQVFFDRFHSVQKELRETMINRIYSPQSLEGLTNRYSKLVTEKKNWVVALKKMKYMLKNSIEDEVISSSKVKRKKSKIAMAENKVKELEQRINSFTTDFIKQFFPVYHETIEKNMKGMKDDIVEEFKKREVEKKKMENLQKNKSRVPKHFICALSKCVMSNPMILIDSGNTYEKKAIVEYLEKNNVEPITKKKLTTKRLIPNVALKKAALALKIFDDSS